MKYILLSFILFITFFSHAQLGSIGLNNIDLYNKLGKPQSVFKDRPNQGETDLTYWLPEGKTYTCTLNKENICYHEILYDRASTINYWINYMNEHFAKFDEDSPKRRSWADISKNVHYFVELNDDMTMVTVEAYQW